MTSERGVRPTDLLDTIDLARDRPAPADGGRCERVFTAASAFVEAGEAIRLDPTRVAFDPAPRAPERRWTRGPIGSLILHLLPLATLIAWPRTPLEIPAPIPVQLVIEQPPPAPPPPEQPKAPAKPPPGLHSSDDFAEAVGPKAPNGAGEAPPSAGAPPPPPATRAAEAAPPKPDAPEIQKESQKEPQPQPAETQAAEATAPKPAPPVEPARAAPRLPPAETRMAAVVPPPPKPPPKERPRVRMPKPLGDSWPLPLHPSEARQTAAHIGPNATRDEYCAYALSLTLRHLNLLPASLVGARRGATVLSIRVLEDGTIQNVQVARSSGYPDIDARVEQMVLAVGRFPPLPQWLLRPWMDFTFQLHFPHTMSR